LALQVLRERVQRAGAPALGFDAKGKAAFESIPDAMQGSDSGLLLTHDIRLTPADCQGHEASDGLWLMDDFALSNRHEWVCKDGWRDNTSYQSLVDGVSSVQFRYAQVQAGQTRLLQWLPAEAVTDWNAVQGLAVCIQVQTWGATPLAPSRPCAAGTTGLAWRSVATRRHAMP
jgi:hypothetical protein